jgi:hypothetical protein
MGACSAKRRDEFSTGLDRIAITCRFKLHSRRDEKPQRTGSKQAGLNHTVCQSTATPHLSAWTPFCRTSL